jgi:NADP-dependent 3-hydroxy acid dehydrogenase YdfG
VLYSQLIARILDITGRRMEVLEQAASKYPNSIIPYQCDVTDKDDIISTEPFVYRRTMVV